MGSCSLDFVVGMPKQEGFDTILTVVDKATKMCHFLPCSESITAKDVANPVLAPCGETPCYPQRYHFR